MHIPGDILRLAGLLCVSAFAAFFQDGKDTSGADVDGPYVFEAEGRSWVAKRIVRKESGPAAAVEKLAGAAPEFEVPLPGREKPLKVRLRPAGEPPPSSVPAPERLLALSDIEGNLGALVNLLRAGGVVDDGLEWTFGKGHLVFVGDMFDRGLHVTECLWLLYELQARAESAGGAVHLVLGNHEVMNLTGDLRYVRKKYRENAALLGEKLEELYARRTVLGRWLRTRNAIQRIGDELFVHGGISPAVAEAKVPIQALNDALRKGLLADAWTKPREGPLKWVADGKEGLIWYRGYVQNPIDEKAMDAILAAYDARRVVVGHTIVPEVGFALGGRVLTIDVRHAQGVIQAALRERGDWHRLLPDGRREKLEAKVPEPAGK
jgi:hypothetical protein